MCARIRNLKVWDFSDPIIRQRFFNSIINSVFLYNDKVCIVYNFDDDTPPCTLDDLKTAQNRICTGSSFTTLSPLSQTLMT